MLSTEFDKTLLFKYNNTLKNYVKKNTRKTFPKEISF